MRTAFINELIVQARLHPKVFLMVGDLGYSVVEPFAAEFPDRYVNAGIAEQNMTGMAAGLASEGWHVFTYSIANFPTLRCLEQIRNDVCYHGLAVTVVSVGAGLAYGNLGYSHHAVQDIACLRGLAGMKVLAPADPGEARQCVRHLVDRPGPSYLRLGKAGEPQLHERADFGCQPALVAGASNDGRAIVACGAVLKEALTAAETLRAAGSPTAVYSLPWVSPLAHADVGCLTAHKQIVTVEEHVQAGGIGEMLSLLVPRTVSFASLCVDSLKPGGVGSQEYLRKQHGISAADIVAALSSPSVAGGVPNS